MGDVEELDYTGGLSNVTFHQPGAAIHHRENNRQFPAEYLLVESDDASWSSSDDRTLRLRITPKRAGEFPIQIRGWLCADGYTDCSRQPNVGSAVDQQGYAVELATVQVEGSTTTPAPVADGVQAFLSVSAGVRHTCGVRDDGSVECWGQDYYGQSTPPGGQFDSVSAGWYHTCGVRDDGSVECWGSNGWGPSTPPGGQFSSVSAGEWHSCGVREDNTVECWGENDYGQSMPPGGQFDSVSAGWYHTCGVKGRRFGRLLGRR